MPRGISNTVQEQGSKVTARGVEYKILRVDDVDNGRRRFVLQDADGKVYDAYGKRIQHNTVVQPVVAGQ